MSNSSVLCPWPFLPQPASVAAINLDLANSLTTCFGGCCVPCPYQDILYPSYGPKFQAADILNVISAVLCFVLLLTYLILPSSSQANYPKVCLAISLFMLNGAGFFTITPAIRDLTLCNDAISSANYTNWRCMLQALFVVVGAHGAALWVSVRVYTLFALVVLGKTGGGWKLFVAENLFAWGIPITFGVVTLASKETRFIYGRWCGPNSNLAPAVLYYPIIIYSVPYLIAEIWLLTKITLVFHRSSKMQFESNRNNSTRASGRSFETDEVRQLKQLGGRYGVNVQWKAVRMVIRLNWRGIIMATVAVFTANLTSINALVDISKTKDISAFLMRSLKWLQCIKTAGATLESCEPAAENILAFWRAWSADLLISFLGTEYFILETSRAEWWLGWRDLFLSFRDWVKEFMARQRSRQNSAASEFSGNATSMRSVTGGSMNDELKGVRLHPVALVDDFNPKASKAGV